MNKIKLIVIAVVALAVVEGIGLVYFAKRTHDLSGKARKLADIEPVYERLTNKQNDLLRENEAMKEDRANLISQAKELLSQSAKAKETEESLAKLIPEKKQAEDDRDRQQVQGLALEGQINALQNNLDKVMKERDKLKFSPERTAKEELIKKLKNDLTVLRKAHGRAAAEAKKAEKEIATFKNRETKLKDEKARLMNELDRYKKNYAEAVMKNKSFERELKDMPKKFSELARQNSVLVKESAKVHYNMGVFYTKNKEYTRAIPEFEKAVDLNPDDAYAHFNLGYIYAEYYVDRKKAVDHFRHYLRLTKEDDKDTDWARKYIITWQAYEGKDPIM